MTVAVTYPELAALYDYILGCVRGTDRVRGRLLQRGGADCCHRVVAGERCVQRAAVGREREAHHAILARDRGDLLPGQIRDDDLVEARAALADEQVAPCL